MVEEEGKKGTSIAELGQAGLGRVIDLSRRVFRGNSQLIKNGGGQYDVHKNFAGAYGRKLD